MKPSGPVFDKRCRALASVHVVTRDQVDTMIRKHYIGKWPGVCTLILALKFGNVYAGVLVFALPPRETSKRYGGVTWELARLWIDDAMPKNTETWFVARGIEYIKGFRPEVDILVSYADPSAGHAGVIYKAGNWISDGRTDDERKTPRFDYADAKTGKRYSRKGHVPEGVEITRVPRISKHRFFYRLR